MKAVLIRSALVLTTLAGACTQADDGDGAVAGDTATAAATGPTSIADVGLETPESVLYDDAADVYLVSNINGGPVDRDNNGFIARIRPDGSVEQLKWIEGGVNGVTLNAPKGMAVIGDTLFVSDIDSVRAFSRSSGAPLGARGVPNASFLNDLVAGPDGALYVSDMGVDASFAPDGRAAIYRFEGAGVRAIASGESLQLPNGLAFNGGRLVAVSFGGNVVLSIDPASGETTSTTLPAGQLDGVVAPGDGTLLVSSWEAQTVYRIDPNGDAAVIADNIESPADIGWDSRRHRVLIPLFMGNRIEIRDVH